jgi:sterol 3beta-glucosyltransferase
VQLTNYRMTFHASLLSARPDLAPTAQVIKAGPFIVHRPGLRRKRRRWLELSHDMLSSYANATDKARSRPLLSVLRK